MNLHENLSSSGIKRLRAKINEIAGSREDETSYKQKLEAVFDELLFSISTTIGKVEGADINASEISEQSLIELQQNIDNLKNLLP